MAVPADRRQHHPHCPPAPCIRYAFNIAFNILNKSTLNIFPAPWFLATFQLSEWAGRGQSNELCDVAFKNHKCGVVPAHQPGCALCACSRVGGTLLLYASSNVVSHPCSCCSGVWCVHVRAVGAASAAAAPGHLGRHPGPGAGEYCTEMPPLHAASAAAAALRSAMRHGCSTPLRPDAHARTACRQCMHGLAASACPVPPACLPLLAAGCAVPHHWPRQRLRVLQPDGRLIRTRGECPRPWRCALCACMPACQHAWPAAPPGYCWRRPAHPSPLSPTLTSSPHPPPPPPALP